MTAPGWEQRCPWAGPTDPIQPCEYEAGHDGPHSYLTGREQTPLEVLTEVIQQAHGERADLAKSRAQATAALDALTAAGYEVTGREQTYCYHCGQRLSHPDESHADHAEGREQAMFVRLSIPGNECVHCRAVMGQSLICPGCGWVDPMTATAREQG